MAKLVLPLALMAVMIGAVVWALRPADAPEAPQSAAVAPAPSGVAPQATEPESAAPAVAPGKKSTRKPKFLNPKTLAQRTGRAGMIRQANAMRSLRGTKGALHLPDSRKPTGAMPPPTRAVPMQIAQTTPKEMKATLRSFYANLPRSKKMPARVELEEIIPADTIAALKAQPEDRVTMIGHYPVSDSRGLEEALEAPDDSQTMLGISFVGADGNERREYIRLEPEE
jgi:hypothetical protein